MDTSRGIFKRTELLLGHDMIQRIGQARIIIFGIGGVGSWCAESLIRSGVQYLTLVDADRICETNINRQSMATTQTVGMVKVDVLKARLLEINPEVQITTIMQIYSEETSDLFGLEDYGYIIDAIDSLKHKVHLIQTATKTNATLFSSMGAALKMDPTRIQVAEFWKVKGCPLGAALRQRMKKEGRPSKKFLCVYSDELLPNKGDLYDKDESKSSELLKQANPSKKAQVNGTVMHVTASFGLVLASLVIKDICGIK